MKRSRFLLSTLAATLLSLFVSSTSDAQITLSVNPSSVPPVGAVTVSWNASLAARDWLGLYRSGAGDGSYLSWVYVSCSQAPTGASPSRSCGYALPAISGAYEFRLFANDGFLRLAVSNPVTVSTLPVISIAATTANIAENSGSGTGLFTVSRTGDTGNALTVNYSVSGTATPGASGQPGADYVALPGNVTLPIGSSSATLAVTPIDDSSAEGNEGVVVTLSAHAAYTVGSPSSATVTIVDDEPPRPTISVTVTDSTATEGNSSDRGIITVSRTGSTAAPITVYYALSGSASNGGDYELLPGSVTIQTGSTSESIFVTPQEDTNVEGNESVVLTLSTNANYIVGAPASATVTIIDNDVPAGPSLLASPNSAAPSGTVTVSWSGITLASARDWIALATPGAGNGSYLSWTYVSCSQAPSVARPSGSCVYGLPASPGTYEFRLFSNDGFSRLATSAPVTISTLPVVTIAATTANVGEESLAATGLFTVTRTGSNAASLTVNYTVSGTATPGSNGQAGADYVALPGSVTISQGSNSATIVVTPINDSSAEGNESVVVALGASAAYSVGAPASATVTIVDDEPPPPTVSLTVTDGSATEGSASDKGIITVNRTGSLAASLTVFYALSGSAINGTDYELLPGSITIEAGSNTASVFITTREDTFNEGSETVVITLTASGAYVLGSPITGTVTIVDNDLPPGPSLTVSPGIVAPGAVLTATWSGIPNPTARDWIGIYAAGANDGSFLNWMYVSCSRTPFSGVAAGSCPISVPTINSTYELRFFANDGFGRVAVSSPFAVSPLTTNVLITAPARSVSAAPNVATVSIARQECNTTFSVPYIQTTNTLNVSAVPSALPGGGGIKFVLNENLPGQTIQFSMAPPFRATFAGLAKGDYRVDAYIVDSSQNVVAGALNRDFLTQLGIGDIYVAIGDSITEGYDGVAYNVPPYTSWLPAPISSIDHRNYPQCGISSGAYQDHWQEASHHITLNDRLEAFFDSPNFILNEGVAGINAGGYLSRMAGAQWQSRINALRPNKWLIHLGSNDAGGSAAFQNTMQSIINILKNTYGAAGTDIVLAVPQNKTNWQPYINNLVSANGLAAGPDFNAFYLNHPTLLNTNNPVHPNAAGHAEMARLWALSMMAPENVVAQSAGAGQVQVSWDDLRLLEPTIAGFKVFYGTNPATLTSVVNVGSAISTVINIATGTHYFSVQAYDNDAFLPNLTGRSAPVSVP